MLSLQSVAAGAGSKVEFEAENVRVAASITGRNASFVLAPGTALDVAGDFWMGSSTVVNFTSSSRLGISGVAYLDGRLVVRIFRADLQATSRKRLTPQSAPVATQQTIDVASYGSHQGSFSETVVTLDSGCESIQSSNLNVGQSQATLSVTLAPNNLAGCPGAQQSDGGGLSTGAIVGIAVGSAAAVVLVMVVILAVIKHRQSKQTDAMFARARKVQKDVEMGRA